MPRIAFFTPLPPAPTGIADYSAEILPALSAAHELEVFTDEPRHVPPELTEIINVGAFDDFRAADGYDLCIYQIGNQSTFHGRIHRLALEQPGLAVVHEYMLHDLVRETAISHGGFEAYARELQYCLGRTGARLARELRGYAPRFDRWRYPLFERLVDRSLATAVHSRSARQRILASRPRAIVHHIPHHLFLGEQAPTATVATTDPDFGLPALREASPVIGVFGIIATGKRIDLCLRAFAHLRRAHPRAALLLVGAMAPHENYIRSLLAGDLGAGVIHLGRVELPRLFELMAGVDVAINLREPTAGETSGSCMRLLGLAKPVIVSDHGWFSEIPDGCCVKLARDPSEETLLRAFLAELIEQPELRARIGRNARSWVEREHCLERTIEAYGESIEKTMSAGSVPTPAVVPLLPSSPNDVAAELIVELSAAMGDLGLDEGVDSMQQLLARTLLEMEAPRR